MITEADVQELVEEVYAAQLQWVNGTLDSLFDLSQGTIFGPFGGPAMGGPGLGDGQAGIAARFHDGTTDLEVVQSIISGDVVCLVMVEHNMTRFDDDREPRRWVLRSTMVFRRDGEAWTLLHRHADPLIDRRGFEGTLALLPREG
jgi:ketosteroid isomerase-like protein